MAKRKEEMRRYRGNRGGSVAADGGHGYPSTFIHFPFFFGSLMLKTEEVEGEPRERDREKELPEVRLAGRGDGRKKMWQEKNLR